MSLKSICAVGCCITIAVLALLVGINSLMRSRQNSTDHAKSEAYSIAANCTLVAIYARTVGSGDSSCVVRRYTLDVGPLTPGAPPLGYKLAYSNFFPDGCYGVVFNASQLGSQVPCWAKDAVDDFVRVSAVYKEYAWELIVGVVCCVVSGVILLCFIGYNAVLWAGICADVGPFSNSSRQRRDQNAGTAAAVDRQRHATMVDFAAAGPGSAEAIKVADQGWLQDMAFNNAFARAVIGRFGHNTTSSSSREPIDDEALRDKPVVVQVEVDGASNSMPAIATDHTEEDEATTSPTVPAAMVVVPAQPADSAAVPECCVCWELLADEAVAFPCFHMLCVGCTNRMIQVALDRDALLPCPVCRAEVFPYELRRIVRATPNSEADDELPSGAPSSTARPSSPFGGASG